jgi:peptide-methionine (S)-S-oxide reductase
MNCDPRPSLVATDEPARSRFELRAGDELVGWLDYRPAGDSVILAHTEIAKAHERQGFGGLLVRAALERIARDGRKAIPLCPFAAAYVARHPELAEHVDRALRPRFILRADPAVFGAKENTMTDNTETAILAGGCFWGVQELLRHREGVVSTRVGYTGGHNENPTYRNHPGHAEAVEIVFDPDRISYRDILEFFFQIHDPTTKDRQGNDFGSDYRSEIFYTSDEQRQVAEDTIADVDASGLWPGKVVTEISEAVPFWVAEAEHQDYLQRYPAGYNCHFPRPGWKLPHRETTA